MRVADGCRIVYLPVLPSLSNPTIKNLFWFQFFIMNICPFIFKNRQLVQVTVIFCDASLYSKLKFGTPLTEHLFDLILCKSNKRLDRSSKTDWLGGGCWAAFFQPFNSICREDIRGTNSKLKKCRWTPTRGEGGGFETFRKTHPWTLINLHTYLSTF